MPTGLSADATARAVAEPFRVLVTGSRDWPDERRVEGALEALAAQQPVLTVVHGDAFRGPDFIAGFWVRRQRSAGRAGICEEPHPADWDRFGKRAGMLRNAEMVRAGAGMCFAWIAPCSQRNCRRAGPHGSHGATDCADRAERAGIETRRWYTETMLALLDGARPLMHL